MNPKTTEVICAVFKQKIAPLQTKPWGIWRHSDVVSINLMQLGLEMLKIFEDDLRNKHPNVQTKTTFASTKSKKKKKKTTGQPRNAGPPSPRRSPPLALGSKALASSASATFSCGWFLLEIVCNNWLKMNVKFGILGIFCNNKNWLEKAAFLSPTLIQIAAFSVYILKNWLWKSLKDTINSNIPIGNSVLSSCKLVCHRIWRFFQVTFLAEIVIFYVHREFMSIFRFRIHMFGAPNSSSAPKVIKLSSAFFFCSMDSAAVKWLVQVAFFVLCFTTQKMCHPSSSCAPKKCKPQSSPIFWIFLGHVFILFEANAGPRSPSCCRDHCSYHPRCSWDRWWGRRRPPL